MKRLSVIGMIFIIVFAACQTVFGAAREWSLDTAHSNVYFSIDHIFSKTRGHFNEFTSEVHFDPENLKESSFNFELQVKSIDTNITKRDKHLQSADFFDVSKYPTITFASQSINDAGNGLYEINGILRVKDTDYNLVLPLTLAGIAEHPAAKGKQVAGFNGQILFDRLAHGIGSGKLYEMGVVGKDVEIFVTLELLSAK